MLFIIQSSRIRKNCSIHSLFSKMAQAEKKRTQQEDVDRLLQVQEQVPHVPWDSPASVAHFKTLPSEKAAPLASRKSKNFVDPPSACPSPTCFNATMGKALPREERRTVLREKQELRRTAEADGEEELPPPPRFSHSQTRVRCPTLYYMWYHGDAPQDVRKSYCDTAS